ncbi:MAG: hypothetical protein LBG60_03795 [Bifidobacteriaceae bacterium]|nr:hypothetical protein [Bifidobacteriaceae bacterium]
MALGYESAYFGLHKDGGQGWKWVTSESTEFMNWHEGEPGGSAPGQ